MQTIERPSRRLSIDLDGVCIVCVQPTDTVYTVDGEAEIHASLLIRLGMSGDEAWATLSAVRNVVPAERYEQVYRVCTSCARLAGLPEPALHLAHEPLLVQTSAAKHMTSDRYGSPRCHG